MDRGAGTEGAEGMNCQDVRARLVDLLYAELPEEDHAGVSRHLEQCPDCQAAWLELRAVSSALDRWTAPAPRGIAERVLATLAIREAAAARAQGPVAGVMHLLGFLLAGAGAAALSLLLLGGGAHPGDTPLKVGLVGAAWTALYGSVAFLARHGRHRRLALAALIGAGLSVLLGPVLSMPDVIEACRRWLEAAQVSTSLKLVLLLAGTLYGAAPVFVSGAIVTRTRPSGMMLDGLQLGGAYGLLIAPSVYLQCHALALSLIAPWVAGVLLGALVGSTLAVSVASRLRPVSA